MLQKNANPNWQSMDLVFGGDHGQGKFRAVVKVTLRHNDDALKNETSILKVGHVDCEKDTYDILKNTIAAPLNESLKQIVGTGLTFARSGPDDCDIEATFSISPKNIQTVRVFITGDLAFYAAALGKESMASSWCWLCKLSKKEWNTYPHEVGDKWTFHDMAQIIENIANNNLADIPRVIGDSVPIVIELK